MMQLDRNMLNRLLSMNDDQLGEMIRKIALESGIDPAQLGMNTQNINSIRNALNTTSDQDLEKLSALYENYRRNRHQKDQNQ